MFSHTFAHKWNARTKAPCIPTQQHSIHVFTHETPRRSVENEREIEKEREKHVRGKKELGHSYFLSVSVSRLCGCGCVFKAPPPVHAQCPSIPSPPPFHCVELGDGILIAQPFWQTTTTTTTLIKWWVRVVDEDFDSNFPILSLLRCLRNVLRCDTANTKTRPTRRLAVECMVV